MLKLAISILWVLLQSAGARITSGLMSASSSTCEPIKIPLCKSLGYNMTRMPNLANYTLQSHARSELDTFIPLIQSQCSVELQFFLCSVFAPMCVADMATPQKVIGPCKPLCERVRKKCISSLKKYDFPWPDVLNCNKFPVLNNHKHMCMEGHGAGIDGNKHIKQANSDSILNALQRNPLFLQKVIEKLSNNGSKIPDPYQDYVDLLEGETIRNKNRKDNNLKQSSDCGGLPPEKYVYIVKYGRCIRKCQVDDDGYFNDNVMDALLDVFVIISMSIILLSLIFASLDYSNSFYYPEKVLIFLSLSFLGFILGESIRLIHSREDASCQTSSDVRHLIQDGQRNSVCFTGFLFLYFFYQAIFSWFVMFCLCLNLATLLKWQQKQFLKFASAFHTFGWGIPALLTLVALVTNKMEADPMTGLCFVGSQMEENLFYFVLLPQSFLVALTILFLLSFAIGSCKTGSEMKTSTNSSEMSFIKKMVFSLLFFFIQIFIYITFQVEYSQKSRWMVTKPHWMPFLRCMRLVFLHLNAILCAYMIISHAKPKLSWIGMFFARFRAKEQQNPRNVDYSEQQNMQEMEVLNANSQRQYPRHHQQHNEVVALPQQGVLHQYQFI